MCVPFDVLAAFSFFIKFMLRHAFVSNHVFGLCLLHMLLSFHLVLYLLKDTGSTQSQTEETP
jgi:hypothetical protein